MTVSSRINVFRLQSCPHGRHVHYLCCLSAWLHVHLRRQYHHLWISYVDHLQARSLAGFGHTSVISCLDRWWSLSWFAWRDCHLSRTRQSTIAAIQRSLFLYKSLHILPSTVAKKKTVLHWLDFSMFVHYRQGKMATNSLADSWPASLVTCLCDAHTRPPLPYRRSIELLLTAKSLEIFGKFRWLII